MASNTTNSMTPTSQASLPAQLGFSTPPTHLTQVPFSSSTSSSSKAQGTSEEAPLEEVASEVLNSSVPSCCACVRLAGFLPATASAASSHVASILSLCSSSKSLGNAWAAEVLETCLRNSLTALSPLCPRRSQAVPEVAVENLECCLGHRPMALSPVCPRRSWISSAARWARSGSPSSAADSASLCLDAWSRAAHSATPGSLVSVYTLLWQTPHQELELVGSSVWSWYILLRKLTGKAGSTCPFTAVIVTRWAIPELHRSLFASPTARETRLINRSMDSLT
mmetsp:Transcript_20769/g.45975  ORF Transcript_20769/g.45975 Transcript_20769/m.45975 type:complete len:281 (-) Transcript_20769:172-1014(-)